MAIQAESFSVTDLHIVLQTALTTGVETTPASLCILFLWGKEEEE